MATQYNDKQKRFVQEYLIDLNATAAAKRAGYSAKAAAEIGYENLRKPHIQEAISKAQQARSERTEITADRVLQEYATVAFTDMAHYLQLTADGGAYLDFSAIPEGGTRAISEIIQEEYMEGRGEDARQIRRTKFKLHSKLGALDSIARHLGMFVDRHEHAGHGGGTIEHRVVVAPAPQALEAVETTGRPLAPVLQLTAGGNGQSGNGQHESE